MCLCFEKLVKYYVSKVSKKLEHPGYLNHYIIYDIYLYHFMSFF